MMRGMPTRTGPPPAERLEQLLDRRRELIATAEEAERRMRFGSSEVSDAKAAVEQAERARLSRAGSAQAVADAEARLAEARAAQDLPWRERLTGARSAIRDADKAISEHIAANYERLAAEHNERAEQAAQAVDAALRVVLDAIREREAFAGHAASLWRWVANPRPDLLAVAASRPTASCRARSNACWHTENVRPCCR
jgi:hypothetical protein